MRARYESRSGAMTLYALNHIELAIVVVMVFVGKSHRARRRALNLPESGAVLWGEERESEELPWTR